MATRREFVEMAPQLALAGALAMVPGAAVTIGQKSLQEIASTLRDEMAPRLFELAEEMPNRDTLVFPDAWPRRLSSWLTSWTS